MKVEHKSGDNERRLLTALIVDKVVLSAVAQKWQNGLFRTHAGNLIASWCVKHYKKYGKAPGPVIQNIYEDWATTGTKDNDTIKSIETILSYLSDNYTRLRKSSQSQYLIDLAGNYFTENKLKDYAEQLDNLIRNGEVQKADQLLKTYTKVELGQGSTINVLEDDEAWIRSFEKQSDPVIIYPGAAGTFFQDVLERNGFIAIEGPTGISKSFWLQDFAWRALLQGRKVAMFQCGDMSEDQTMMRLASRIANRPIEPCEVNIPISLEPSIDDGFVKPVFQKKKWDDKLSIEQLSKCRKKLRQKQWYTKNSFKLETYPARGVSIFGIKSRLDSWATEGWNPDVIVIDYADILAPPNGQTGDREEINSTWLTMRAISVQYHCLVITATQSNRASYDSTVIKLEHTSDDRRKMDHVTASIGLTRTQMESELGIFRLMWVKPPRKRKVTITRTLFTAGALELGNPCMLSTF